MRSLQEAQSRWSVLEKYTSVTELSDAITASSNDQSITDGLRSVCWKSLLLFHTLNTSQWPAILNDTRDAYDSLRSRFLHSLEHPDEADSSLDPLSDSLDSPWDALRKDELLRQEINRDVERCMPDNLYFRRPETQSMLLDVLFVWTKLNPDIGYRQGIHELLAPILWVVERDAVEIAVTDPMPEGSTNSSLVLNVFDATFIGHDSFTLFTQIMKDAKSSYELAGQTHQASLTAKSPIAGETASAIVARSARIVDEYLALVDPHLAEHLADINIAPQIFLMRWIRLLFGREFTFDQMLQIWDRLFAVGNTSEQVDLVCVAMLLRIRWDLINADYNTTIQYLLRYPELPVDQGPPSLVDDAIFLKSHLNFDGGYEIVKMRTNRPLPLVNRPTTPLSTRGDGIAPHRPQLPILDRFSGQAGSIEALLSDAVHGINTRGEKWGVYKAVRDVAGEVRKNVSTIQSKTHSRIQSRGGSTTISRENSTKEELIQSIDALHIRNKFLAGMLEGTVAELWQQQKNASTENSITTKQIEAFTTTIAKVQFVQIYLEDPSLDLPAQDPAFAPVIPDIQPLVGNQKKSPLSSPVDSEDASSYTSGPKESEEGLRNFLPTDKTDQPDVQVDGIQAAQIKSTPRRKTHARPSLEHSSFSWMLGQEPHGVTPRHTFVSASPFSDHSSRTKSSTKSSTAFLFGDEDDVLENSSKATSDMRDKGKEEADDKYRLGNLGGKR